jgi:hypothetical protein
LLGDCFVSAVAEKLLHEASRLWVDSTSERTSS